MTVEEEDTRFSGITLEEDVVREAEGARLKGARDRDLL